MNKLSDRLSGLKWAWPRHDGRVKRALELYQDALKLEADGLVAVIVDQHASSALERCHVGGWAPTP